MKMVLFALLFTGAPHWLSTSLARTPDGKCATKARVATVSVDDTTGGDKTVIPARGEPGQAVVHVVDETGHESAIEVHANAFVVSSKKGEDGEKLHWIARVGEGDKTITGVGVPREGSGGWLGVSIGECEAAVADQLGIEGRGVAILNVLKESPAEKAGIEAHDIVLSIDGEAVSGDVGKTVELVSSHEPGDEIEVLLLRDGDEVTVEVELGSRADMKSFDWKFDIEPLAEIEESIQTHGTMLFRDDDGNWTVQRLGGPGMWQGLGGKLGKLGCVIPPGKSRCTKIFVDGNSKSLTLEVKQDDGTLVIERKDGGDIVVTRADADGSETKTTYADEDALADGDPEAAELFSGAGKPIAVRLDLHGLKGLADVDFDFDLDFDPEDFKEGLFDWHADLQGQLSDVGESYRRAIDDARKAFQEAMQQWHDVHADDADPSGAHPPIPFLDPTHIGEGLAPAHRLGQHLGKPKHSFTVQKDGTIEVRIRKGDSELVQLFEDADDLARRDEGLFEKYQGLMEAGE